MMSCNTPSIDQTNEAVELSFFYYGYSIFQSFKLNLWRLGYGSEPKLGGNTYILKKYIQNTETAKTVVI